MAAPRATQFVALRNLSRNAQQVRNLHMTGPKDYASSVLSRERSVLNLPRDIAGLRAECKRRKIDTAGSKHDLIARLNADELVHSRAFSSIAERRPTVEQSNDVSASTKRYFNTSREMKAVKDTSTIDFAYMPTELTQPQDIDVYANMRVPILPTLDSSDANLDVAATAEAEAPIVMKPQISTMSADAVFLPMSDLSDGHAMNIDFYAMADRVARNLRAMKVPVEQQASIIKQVWSDMVDDLLSGNKKAANA